MNTKKLIPILGSLICLASFGSLLFCDYTFAGVISNWWYFVNAAFWISVFILCKKANRKKVGFIALMTLLGIAWAYTASIPTYSYEEAAKIVQSEQASIRNTKVDSPWEYRSFTDSSIYLLVFKTDVPEAFWFNPYSGNYGAFDIESRLPFLFSDDEAS